MASRIVLSAAEQVAAHLRAEMVAGRWRETLPGVYKLAPELEVSRTTVEAALLILEEDGVLVNQGPGRRRRIELAGSQASPSMRVAILPFEDGDRGLDYIIEIQRKLTAAGQAPFLASKSLLDLGMNVKRVARFVKKVEADAWVVVAGSREVLEWFTAQPAPAFALFGRRHNVDIASTGPTTSTVISTVAQRLIKLGHRRIVLMSRRARRLPQPAKFERAFLAALETHGLAVGPYNLPDWEESRQGLYELLDSLFHLTPPTALIVDEPPQFTAVLRFLAERGIRTPKDISLVCTDPDRNFDFCEPPISHVTYDMRKVVRPVVNWASAVSQGKEDRRQTDIQAEFVEGGTIGPAPKSQ